jgi:hypothetical protein
MPQPDLPTITCPVPSSSSSFQPTPILPNRVRSAFCFLETKMANTTETFLRFAPGQIVATPGALALLSEHGITPDSLLRRHLAGDWGAVCSDDAALNDAALADGSRILSSYLIAPGVSVWVITDAETDIDEDGNTLAKPTRLCTTILRPEDY